MPCFTARAGMTLRASTGLEELGHHNRMSTIFFTRAASGDNLTLTDNRYLFNVATYAMQIDARYIYTYSYQPDQSWTVYNGDLSGDTYRTDNYVFDKDCYFRLCLKRTDGADLTDAEADNINDIIRFDGREPIYEIPDFIEPEAARTAAEIDKLRRSDSLVFALLADTHVTVNGTWPDTLESLRAVNNAVKFDGVIHLGDITDGMATAAATRRYVADVKRDLLSLDCPLYIAIGNHDCNYFGKNSEPFTIEEQMELYLGHIGTVKPWYNIDYPGLRLIFLHSYDRTERKRYGFSGECLDWLEKTLETTPKDLSVIIFSHLTPLTNLQVWTDHIRGGERLAALLRVYGARRRLLAYINGHNHADQIDNSLGIPIISTGCAKLECFYDHKPNGSTTPKRIPGDKSQELWDVLVVTPGGGHIERVRFGADRDA